MSKHNSFWQIKNRSYHDQKHKSSVPYKMESSHAYSLAVSQWKASLAESKYLKLLHLTLASVASLKRRSSWLRETTIAILSVALNPKCSSASPSVCIL